MTLRERSDLITSVASGLVATAEKPQEIRNDRFAATLIGLARIINGCAGDGVACRQDWIVAVGTDFSEFATAPRAPPP